MFAKPVLSLAEGSPLRQAQGRLFGDWFSAGGGTVGDLLEVPAAPAHLTSPTARDCRPARRAR
ncbi:MAG: hypothetical protein ACE5LU_12730 [Anaerolineae bacterium]